MRANPFRILVAVAIQATVVATASFALAAVLPRAFDGAVVRLLVGAVTLFVANTLPVAAASIGFTVLNRMFGLGSRRAGFQACRRGNR